MLVCKCCGEEIKISGGFEEWSPSYYDPDSGGVPFDFVCEKCGFVFTTQEWENEEKAITIYKNSL